MQDFKGVCISLYACFNFRFDSKGFNNYKLSSEMVELMLQIWVFYNPLISRITNYT